MRSATVRLVDENAAGGKVREIFDDIKRTNLSRSFLKTVRDQFLVRVRFRVMAYQGKYKQSKKPIKDLPLLGERKKLLLVENL